MARAAFVLAPHLRHTLPHLGIAYLRSSAEEDGHDTAYFDFAASHTTKSPLPNVVKNWQKSFSKETRMETFFTFLPSVIYYFDPPKDMDLPRKTLYLYLKSESEQMAQSILEYKPDVVCFSIVNDTLLCSLSIAQAIKEKQNSVRIIFGGPFLDDTRVQQFIAQFHDYVDLVVAGEGEHIIKNILNGTTNHEQRIAIQQPVNNIDSLAFPTFNGFAFDHYYRNMALSTNRRGLAALKEKILPIIANRGCPFSCTFCSDRVVWKQHRRRTVDNVIAELKNGQSLYDCHVFRFNDSLMNVDRTWLRHFCEALLDQKMNIYWYGEFRADKIDDSLARLMFNAGCRFVRFGIESGSRNVLKLMNKKITPEQAEKAICTVTEAGLKVRISLIYGYPGETWNDLQETSAFVHKMVPMLHEMRSSYFIFMPGTPLETNAKQHNIELHNFNVPDNASTNSLLGEMPETWSHPMINDEEFARRKEFVKAWYSLFQKNCHYLPYMFSDVLKQKLKPDTPLLFKKSAAKVIEEEGIKNILQLVPAYDEKIAVPISSELYNALVQIQNFTFDSLTSKVRELDEIYRENPEELVIGLISLDIVTFGHAQL